MNQKQNIIPGIGGQTYEVEVFMVDVRSDAGKFDIATTEIPAYPPAFDFSSLCTDEICY